MRAPSLVTAGTALAGLLLGGCAALTGDATGLSGVGNGDVAARAGDQVVTVTALREAVEDAMTVVPTDGLDERAQLEQRLDVQADLLSSLTQIAIVEAAAEDEFGIEISEQDVAAAVEVLVEQAGGAEAFADQLATQNQTELIASRSERIGLLIDLVSARLVEDEPVTDEEVETAVAQQLAPREQVEASHILVATAAEAQDALDRLAAGESFEDLATELSTDPGSAANGGSLGLAPRGAYVEPFEAAIWEPRATPGEVLGPVETQFGFHLIRVDEFVDEDPEGLPSEEELREQTRANLTAARGGELFNIWVSQVLSEADPEVAPRFGSWSRTQQSVVRDGAEADQAPGA